MAGKHMPQRAFLRMMAKRKGADYMGFIDDLHTQLGRWITGAVVMVAAHQRQLKRRMRLTPTRHGVQRLNGMRALGMQEVAQEHDVPGVRDRHQLTQHRQGFAGRATWHRHAATRYSRAWPARTTEARGCRDR